MIVKYKNKKYNSEDLPIFLYFNVLTKKRDFIDNLAKYKHYENFEKFSNIHAILAGNTLIKDKRFPIYLNFNSLEEKQNLQRHIFNTDEESNAIVFSPGDIKPSILCEWIEKNINRLI